ncbi:hypothetical protein E4420_17690 [Stenotrophomonas maltophilia]|nr:hypothetical protein [Stenotrophomonas maltophilia]MBA0415498.1 hypothetical protein [Stenotrophomonas maltophilia]TIL16884.1 hypothetical protein E4420_17690 [Stenotrophomonas maltophilia]
MTELTVASVSPACGRFAPAAAAASWDPIQSGSPSPPDHERPAPARPAAGSSAGQPPPGGIRR